MKKTFTAVLLLLCMIITAACGSAPAPAQPDPTPSAAPAPAAPSVSSVLPGANLSEAQDDPSAVEPSAPAYDEAKFAAAKALIQKSVEELYAAIGEPNDSSYAPSCIGATGEDGELYYDGFTVATYRNDGKEIVWDVNINAD